MHGLMYIKLKISSSILLSRLTSHVNKITGEHMCGFGCDGFNYSPDDLLIKVEHVKHH
jgi:hypothetical protein